jgi:hypothetical protein
VNVFVHCFRTSASRPSVFPAQTQPNRDQHI